MQSSIVQPKDNNDVNTGKNYILNKITMNPDGTIDEGRFGIGIFYEDEGKLYQATDIDESIVIKKIPNNLSTPKFTRSTVSGSVTLNFYENIVASSFYLVLLIRDNFDNELKPIFRQYFDPSNYESGGNFLINRVNFNLNLGDPSEYFVFAD